jgi:hypothetical protein
MTTRLRDFTNSWCKRPRPALRSSALTILAALVFVACSTETPGTGGHEVATSTGVATANPAWLEELNHLRAIGGLKPVEDDPQLSKDCYARAKYLIDQGPTDPNRFVNYRVALGLGAHHEDPHSKYYSEAGVVCAEGGTLQPGFAHSNDVSWGPIRSRTWTVSSMTRRFIACPCWRTGP